MLELAYFNQSELYECYKKMYEDESKMYFYLSYPQKDFVPVIYSNDSEYLQFVSKDSKNNVIGFFTGYINKEYQSLQRLELIKFSGRINIIFSKDVEAYFDSVFLYKNLRKIEFSCIEENPAISVYRKLIKKFNGREIGTEINSKKLTDGNYYNNVLFEIYRENYLAVMEK